jgi:hypothetical protein
MLNAVAVLFLIFFQAPNLKWIAHIGQGIRMVKLSSLFRPEIRANNIFSFLYKYNRLIFCVKQPT